MSVRKFSSSTHACMHVIAAAFLIIGSTTGFVQAADPDPASYWDVRDLRPGMKGTGKTVMLGTELVEFQVEVLGVLRDVNPGRDMILCRLSGCNLEHAGIIQGMSGSPIYIDNKLVGAVAYAWEFAKDPIAGVTPFSQMVQYVQANERRIAAEPREREAETRRTAHVDPTLFNRDALADGPTVFSAAQTGVSPVSGGGMAGMRPIATPLAATGFSPNALSLLNERLGPLGLAPMAGGGVLDDILAREGHKRLEPGSPISVAMVTGDFDVSGIGTVTHVEGDRVYAFGHPMMGLGACELPMMTGYIHTVYPRASVSMKMGSPMKVVGVLDTDVSTAVSGRMGAKPDMMPMSVRIEAGRFAEPHVYHVEIAREPKLLPTLVLSVLTSAIDTEGDMPDELTARVAATIKLANHPPIVLRETLSGPRLGGPMGGSVLFSSIANTVTLLSRNPLERVRIESIDCQVTLEPRRTTADLESLRLATDRIEPGGTLHVLATLKPFKGERQSVSLQVTLPADLPPGTYEASVCDVNRSTQRLFRNEPGLLEPKNVDELISLLRVRSEPPRNALYLHVALPGRGLAIAGQALPDLPSSVRSVFASSRKTADPPLRTDLSTSIETPWVIEGGQVINFTVVKDRGTTAVLDEAATRQ